MIEHAIRVGGRLKFWFLASAIFVSLIYSTSLQYAYLTESTISLSYFQNPGSHNLQTWFPDIGSLKDATIQYQENDFWKMTSFWEDSAYYLLQNDLPNESVPPFRYRVLPVLIVKVISTITGWPTPKAYVALNVLLTYASALLFTWYLLRFFDFSKLLALLGGVLFVTMVSNTRTIPFPMMEPASMFFIMLIFIAVRLKNIPLFIVSSLCGIATKEILVVASVMWVLENWRGKSGLQLIGCFAVALVPILGFVVLRVSLGGAPMEVSYGYNALLGELPDTVMRLFGLTDLFSLGIRAFLSFSFLWLGLVNLRKDAFLFRQSIVILIVVIAAFVLSRNVVRVLGVLFPIVIPLFLLFFKSEQENQPSIPQAVT